MSAMSAWVRARDGGFYRDPVLVHVSYDAWICFDVRDPPELVVACYGDKSAMPSATALTAMLGGDGWAGPVSSPTHPDAALRERVHAHRAVSRRRRE